jgi:predicted permease
VIRDGVRRVFKLAARSRGHWERDVEDEIKTHLALRAEQLLSQGVTPEKAYEEAVRRFGPLKESRARMVDAARHREQRMHRTEYFADLRQDLSFALRTLRRDIGWTSVTLATLALGIAATTAVFSAVSSLLLHAVAYPSPDRVVLAFQQPMKGNNTGVNVTIIPELKVLRAWKTAKSLETLEAYGSQTMELKTTGEPAKLQVQHVEPTFPKFAGGQPMLGRMFGDEEARSDAHVAVLGEGAWRTRFGGERSAIGKTITLDDSIYTIIGVLPARVQPPVVGATPIDIWLPLNITQAEGGALAVGRIRPGVSEAVAERELDTLTARATGGKLAMRTVLTTPAKRVSFRDSLVLLAAAVALVLLVACANVAHLLMARASTRGRELAIRVALGAGQGRVFRQLLTESVVLALAGGAIGVAGGWLGLRAIIGLRPASLQSLAAAHLDATTLEVALAVTIITSIVFGLLGALQTSRASTFDTLKGTARSSTRPRGRQILVITEMALSATLVVGAAMLVRSVSNLQHADLGYDTRGLYGLTLEAPRGHFGGAANAAAMRRRVVDRIRAMPGVTAVALASSPPGWFSFRIGRLEIDGEPNPAMPATSFNAVMQVGSGYFATMGTRLVAGAGFTDTTDAAGQVILNENFVRKQWHGQSAIGKRIRISSKGDEPWLTVVGVAQETQTAGPMQESTAPLIYSAAADSDAHAIMFRTTQTADLLPRVKALVASMDPGVTTNLNDIQGIVDRSIAAPKFVMLLLTVFTVLALMLAAVGLYGVMAHTVAQRTREIGIRVALGAPRSLIARGVIVAGVWLALIGMLIGGAVSMWGTKLIESQLFGVAARDPASMIAASVVLFAVAIVACVVPARRALAVDPMTAIRAD